MNPDGFLADIETIPRTLMGLAESLAAQSLPLDQVLAAPSVLLLGMGSSGYAAGVAAARLRSNGYSAVAELASSELLPPPHPDLLVIAVSTSGESAETVAAARRYAGRCPVVAVTDAPGSAVTEGAQTVLPLLAGPESGGVACRSYRHTLAVLLALADRLSPGTAPTVADACRRAADATTDLLDRRGSWLNDASELLGGPNGTWVVGPAARLASAQQSALMLREGPRRGAQSCETGDWSHVDVYLTKTLDYRMLFFPGSPYDDELLRWTADRRSVVVSVGAAVAGAQLTLGYPGDDNRDVALLTDTTVAELVAHHWWAAGSN